jgi:hypothetical protein
MNNMASNKEFPQFTENIAERPGSACNGGTADGFRVSPAVHHRPSGLKSAEITEHGVLLSFGASARKSKSAGRKRTCLILPASARQT